MRGRIPLQTGFRIPLQIVLLGCLLAASPASRSAATDARDAWFVVSIMEHPAGWVHQWEDDGGVRSEESQLRIEREGTAVSLWARERFTAGDQTDPPRSSFRSSTAPGETVEVVVEYLRDSLVVATRSGAVGQRAALTRPADLLAPDSVAALLSRLQGGALQRTRFVAFEAELGLPVAYEASWEGSEELLVRGARHRCDRIRLRAESMPELETVEWRDSTGATVKMEQTALGAKAEIATREECLAPSVPPDIIRATTLALDRPLDRTAPYPAVHFHISSTDGGKVVIEPHDGMTLLASGPDWVDVRVERPLRGESEGERETPSAGRGASVWIDSTDPEVQRAALREGGTGTDLERVERLTHFVARHIRQKDLSVAFATASATLESGEGDCTEHAVLLAALLRATGVPARVVAGLVAYGREMGYHMWTEAWDGRRWIGCDAAFDRVPTDGRYIPLSASDLSSQSPSALMVNILHTMGRIRVEVNDQP